MRSLRPFAFLVSLLLVAENLCAAEPAPVWKITKSDHFIIYSAAIDEEFSAKVLKNAETYYDEIAGWLGYPRRASFWTWNNRCKIYIYESKEEYIAKTGHALWSKGAAILNRRTIVSYHEAADFTQSVLPHEIAHLIFRDFVGGPSVSIPLWLDEGVAMAQEKLKRQEFDSWVHQMILEKKWIEMKPFMEVRSLGNVPGDQAVLFYAQAQSVARFLIDHHGSTRFAAFCRSLRDSELPEAALRKNYPSAFPDLKSFENRWVEYVSKNLQQGVPA